MKASTCISRDYLLHAGTCLGKFTKSGKFRLHITALDYLAQHALYKVWVKTSAEMSFLYGSHITKNGLARMTENTPQYAGVVVYSMSTDTPLGFGVAAQSTEHSQQLDPTGNVVLHQADVGEYLRGLEDDIFRGLVALLRKAGLVVGHAGGAIQVKTTVETRIVNYSFSDRNLMRFTCVVGPHA